MQPTSKWTMFIEKREYVITGAEVEAILESGTARFVKLKKLVVNPAFIQNIVEVEDGAEKPLQLEDPGISVEQVAKNKARLAEIRAQFGREK